MKKFIRVILVIFVLCGVGCGAYLSDYYHAEERAFESINNVDSATMVEVKDEQIIYVPEDPKAGLIFYPGGKVQYESYAPLMEAFAERGVLCVLLHMPGNLAVLDVNAADGIQDLYPEVKNWYIGGHSLGGAMAASYVSEHIDEYKALLLLAAYSTVDLSESGLRTVSVYGSEDRVLKMESYEENRDNFPKDSVEFIIEGGCHSGFAYYGEQDGDGVPTITQDKQIEKTVEIFLENIE